MKMDLGLLKIEVPTDLPSFLIVLVVIVPWVMGIAVAKGFWIVAGCIFLPPMAWVVLAMHFLGTN